MPEPAFFGPLKIAFVGARDIASGAVGAILQVFTVFRQLAEARAEIARLQDENAAFKARIRELQEVSAREDAFEREHEKYKLKEIGPRAFAYEFQPVAEDPQPPHHACVPCFQDRRISILQFEARDCGFDTLKCPRCGAVVRLPNDLRAAGATVPPPGRARRLFDGQD